MDKWAGRITLSVLYGFTIVALWSVLRELPFLMETGGWFAVIGQLMAVISTLIMLFLLGVLCLALVCLPVLLFFAISAPGDIERLTWSGFSDELGRRSLQIANPVWKTLDKSGGDCAESNQNDSE